MGQHEGLTAENLYECLARLWTFHEATSSDLHAAFLAVEIMTYLMDFPEISKLGSDLHIATRGNKMSAAFDIVQVMWSVFHVGRVPRLVRSIKALQAKWMIYKTKKAQGIQGSGSGSDMSAANKIDPFTMEHVKYLPDYSLFGYSHDGHSFVFSGAHLYKHVYIHAYDYNPFTRQQIPYGVICRLQTWYMAYYRFCLVRQSNNRLSMEQTNGDGDGDGDGDGGAVGMRAWTSLGVAFTDVATRLSEFHHITLQPQWMSQLSDFQINGIFRSFHTICGDPTYANSSYMRYPIALPLPSDTQTHTLGYVLAREMMQVILAETSPSFYVCALMVAAADFCKPLRLSLPDWVFDAVYL